MTSCGVSRGLAVNVGVVVLAAALCVSLAKMSAAGPDRRAAPDVTLTDVNGQPVKLSAQKGSVVLLDFWATWCTGCKAEIPWFVEFDRKYRSKGLTAIGAAMDDEGWDVVKPYLKDHPIPYRVVLGNFDLLQQRFGLQPSLPVTLLIDRQGKIADSHPGVVDKAAFEHEINQLLAEKVK
jgi:peroxiredoxin